MLPRSEIDQMRYTYEEVLTTIFCSRSFRYIYLKYALEYIIDYKDRGGLSVPMWVWRVR